MFLSIGDKLYNVLYAQELRKEEKDGKYLIIYTWVNGYELTEEFDTEADRDTKYDEVLEAGIGGGTSDYADLDNKPKINSVTLSGNKTAAELNLLTPQDVSSMYTYKGSVQTYANLPSSGQKTGDTYNIETEDPQHGIKEGDNVAWNGTGWDNFGGVLNLDGYQPKIDANNKLSFAYVNTDGDARRFVGMIPTNSQNSRWDITNVEPGVYFDTTGNFNYTVYIKCGNNNLTLSLVHGPLVLFKKPSEASTDSIVATWKVDGGATLKYSCLAKTGESAYSIVEHTVDTFINKASAQTVSGKKTFSTLPESSVVPTTDDQLTNKAYVDSKAGGAPLRITTATESNPFDLTTADPGFYYILPNSYANDSYVEVGNVSPLKFTKLMEIRLFKKHSDWQIGDVIAEARVGGAPSNSTANARVEIYSLIVGSNGSVSRNQYSYESDPSNWIKSEASFVASDIAPLFSNQSTYSVGAYVIHYDSGYKLYKCTAAVTVAGSWKSSNWTQTTVEEMVSSTGFDPTAITGYNASKTQILKHVNGTLTWVDDYVDGDNLSY